MGSSLPGRTIGPHAGASGLDSRKLATSLPWSATPRPQTFVATPHSCASPARLLSSDLQPGSSRSGPGPHRPWAARGPAAAAAAMGGGHGHEGYRPSGHHYFKGAARAGGLRARRCAPPLRCAAPALRRCALAMRPPLPSAPRSRPPRAACRSRRGVEPLWRLVVRPQGLAAEHGVRSRVGGAAREAAGRCTE